jgi:hypothetical protein
MLIINHLIFVMETYVFFEVGTEFLNIILCSLHDMHDMNPYRTDHLCLSTRFNSRTKFCMGVMQLESTLKLCF